MQTVLARVTDVNESVVKQRTSLNIITLVLALRSVDSVDQFDSHCPLLEPDHFIDVSANTMEPI